MKERLGIYIHIPFCASKCGYCDFYSLAGCEKQMPVYHKALIDHLMESAHQIRNYEVDSIYFGGGTPSYYGAERLLELFDVLKLNGNVRTDTEVTVECNPDSMDFKELRELREEGVNRLSIGVQAVQDDLLRMLGRRHTWPQAQAAFSAARRAGFDNLSVDLMYGLPSQNKRDWAESLARIVELHPEHVSCYALKLEEGTPMYEAYRNSPVLPDDEQADMYSYAAQILERYGYAQYEISNFAAPGFESRHNLKYWRLEDYMGFGPGAHSAVGNLRYSFVPDLKKYAYGISRKVSVIDEYEEISPLERSVEYLMLGMRTARGIEEKEYRIRCQSDWKPILRVLQAFREKGWAVEEEDGRWHFTVSGYLLSNRLIGILLETQAAARLDTTPWMYRPDIPAEELTLPPGEQEIFNEMYEKAARRQ